MKKNKQCTHSRTLYLFLLVFAVLFINLPAHSADTNPSLGIYARANSITGYCFIDANENGVMDADEHGIQGMTVTLKRLMLLFFPVEIGSSKTDAEGRFEFTELRPGLYVVQSQSSSGGDCTTKNPAYLLLWAMRSSRTVSFGWYMEYPMPSVTITAAPEAIGQGERATLSWFSQNAYRVAIDHGINDVALEGTVEVFPAATVTYTITAEGAGGTVQDSVTITVNIPETSTSTSVNTTTTTTAVSSTTTTSGGGGGGGGSGGGTLTTTPATTVPSTSTSIENSTSTSTSVNSTTTAPSTSIETSTSTSIAGGLPPDPSQIAPPIDPGVPTGMKTATEFLYSGDTPIQTGVGSGTIEERRVAVLRGKVMDSAGAALSGAVITLIDHGEYGQTQSRDDGMFDMAVNGGGYLTVQYKKDGYLPAQRTVNVPWQDYVKLPDVVLTAADTAVTEIDLTSAEPMQSAQGSVVIDTAGTRRATLLIPQGTQAQVVLPDGSTQDVEALNIRTTEYSVGDNGPKAMPAELPPNSAFTYCVELTADEAVAKVNGKDIIFNQPVVFYVENFLGAAAGTPVPLGYYDNTRKVWVPAESGRVINIISITAGAADIDVDGDGAADTGTALSALGITDAERGKLAGLYQAGQSLWRMQMKHLSTWDANWAFGPPDDAVFPNQPDPGGEEDDETDCEEQGSIIECSNQVLGQRIPVAGTPFSLNYRSNRGPGRKSAYSLKIPLSGDTVPASLVGIELEISVAGQQHSHKLQRDDECLHEKPLLAAAATGSGSMMMNAASQVTQTSLTNQSYTFTWDGKDAYGRIVQGRQPVTVRIGYTYCGRYQQTERFGYNGGGMITGSRTRQTVTLWQQWQGAIGAWDASGQGLGGWTLSPSHAYDPLGHVLQRGDGERAGAELMGRIVTTVAGIGNGGANGGYTGDGGPAVEAKIRNPNAVTIGPDGSIYFITDNNASGANYATIIRKVDPNGIISTVRAANGTLVKLQDVGGSLAIGPDGKFYYSGMNNWIGHCINVVEADGSSKTIAGNRNPSTGSGFSGDGGPATEARFNNISGIAFSPDGSLYVADRQNHRIRRIGTDGIVETVAGTGVDGFSGDNGPALEAALSYPTAVTVAPDGSVYFADNYVAGSYGQHRVRRIGTNGIITTIAGNGAYCYYNAERGDGLPALDACFAYPRLALGPDGSIYTAEEIMSQVRRIGNDGIVSLFAGRPMTGWNYVLGDNGPAVKAGFIYLTGIACAPDGSVYVADQNNHRIRRIGPLLPGHVGNEKLVPANDGSEMYVFDERHVRTLDALTGVLRYQFGYDSAGLLTSITDGNGNVIAIERDASGNPTAIVAPFGQRTALSLISGNTYLAGITSPAGESYSFGYTDEGLLTTLIDPKGNLHQFTYDTMGRLIKDENPEGGFQALSSFAAYATLDVTLTSGMGISTAFHRETLPTGNMKQLITFPGGLKNEAQLKTDGTSTLSFADGTAVSVTMEPDPRFGMNAPMPTSVNISVPGGLATAITTARTVTLTDTYNVLSIAKLEESIAINGRSYGSSYNGLTRAITETTPAGRVSTAQLDSKGRLTRYQINGLAPVDVIYDSQGRPVKMAIDAAGENIETKFNYNTKGYLGSIIDPLSRTFSYEYDLAGRVTRETLPDSREIVYGYDANGNMVSVTPPAGAAHIFEYTKVDMLAAYRAPDVGTAITKTAYYYNKDLQPAKIARPDGASIDFAYDAAGRLSTLAHPDGTNSYSYDKNTGNLAHISAYDGGGIDYAYQGMLLTNETWSGSIAGAVRRSYDNDLRITGIGVATGITVTYLYNTDSLVTGAGDLSITRDAASGFITGTALGAVTDTWSYNGFGEPTGYSAAYNGAEKFRQQFIYDKLGRISQITETIAGATDSYDYTYDQAGRLITVKKNNVDYSSYSYNSNDNRTGYTGPVGAVNSTSYDAQDRLLQYGATTYTYTDNGELLTKTAGGQTTTYDYDVFGNLQRVSLPDGTMIDYIVDGRNRRIGKKVNNTLVQGFLYRDFFNPVTELDDSGNIIAQFIYGTRSHVPDYMVKGGSTYRLITDYRGSPRIVVAVTSGVIAQRMDYDEFGNVVTDTNPGFQPFGFAGGIFDNHTELVRFGARDYDCATGRWTAKDPIGFEGDQMNLYVYAMNDPVNLIDSNGLEPKPTAKDIHEDIKEFKKTEEYLKPERNKANDAGEASKAAAGQKNAPAPPPKPKSPGIKPEDLTKDVPTYKILEALKKNPGKSYSDILKSLKGPLKCLPYLQLLQILLDRYSTCRDAPYFPGCPPPNLETRKALHEWGPILHRYHGGA